MNKIIYKLFFAVFLLLISCDDGDLHPEGTGEAEGLKATMEVSFSGLKAWPSAYQMVLAAYGNDTENPLMSKQISVPKSENDIVVLDLNGLPEEARTIGISILTKGRKLVYNYYTYDIGNATEDVVLPISQINVASFDRIQHQVFDNYCAPCHDAGDKAAAGLSLTDGKSYMSLVKVKANLSATNKNRIEPGMPSQSFLVDILTEDIVNYNHTDVLPQEELVTLIKEWITQGAKDN
ncbi:hypothetical protein [Parabacteroides bouchesdurhonensis]|uniref:hypothetical protein n=1 Tax=Parabacteroides bouchesdurhonensis TaxID=1936995 RepID=UPI000E522B1F|nr:hypothetical protein [Parabacteroides bouchesdurhonensis]RHJ92132.1 hypothetical protein DW095_08770 [Bacteroides sp. AM07-16]